MTQPDKPVPQEQTPASTVLLLRRNDSRYARGEGAVRVQPHRDGGIRRDVLGDQLAGNQRFNVRLDEAIDGTRTVGGVKGLLDDALDSRVCVIKLIPGMAPGILDYVAEHAHAVVIESFGVGGVPYYDNDEFTEKIGHLLRNHVKVIFTTQVSHEGSDMELYRVGFRIKKKYELLEAYTMTTEAVVAKVEWALANSADDEEFRKLFLTPVGNDRL